MGWGGSWAGVCKAGVGCAWEGIGIQMEEDSRKR